MNVCILIGNLTKDPEIRYTADQMAIASFTLAIDRRVAADREKQTDFPRVTVFGKQAENCERYLAKGRKVAVQGQIRTGSYKNKEGATVYTTEVVADRVKFIDWGDRAERSGGGAEYSISVGDGSQGRSIARTEADDAGAEGGYAALEDDGDIPF
jgi:single-strand DNA-binding protein